MNMAQLVSTLDKASAVEGWADIDDFCLSLNLALFDDHGEFSDKVEKYYLTGWICTDTYVGIAAYYFKEELVAISTQECRKCDEHIQFVSVEAANSIKEFILSLDNKEFSPTLIDTGEGIDSRWFRKEEQS